MFINDELLVDKLNSKSYIIYYVLHSITFLLTAHLPLKKKFVSPHAFP